MPKPPQPKKTKKQPVQITPADLPLCCPMPRTPADPSHGQWDSHPRVYLSITPGTTQTCPYCGTSYTLLPPCPPS